MLESDDYLGDLLFPMLDLYLFPKFNPSSFKLSYYLNDFFFGFFDITIYSIISSNTPFLLLYLLYLD